MATPTTDQAYGANLRAIFDHALASSTKCIEIECNDLKAAHSLRARLYTCRFRERKTLVKTYGENTPCKWDCIVITLSGKNLRLTVADEFDILRRIKEISPTDPPTTEEPSPTPATPTTSAPTTAATATATATAATATPKPTTST